jgi:glycosyltransferase involved in cell wall biosynthesis
LPNQVVFITGRNPELKYGGHDFFVRAHARAAIRAGFEPHLFFAGTKTRVTDSPLGMLHETASPFGFPRTLSMPLNNPLLAPRVERFLLSQPGPHLIHGFGTYGYTGITVSRRLRRHGRQVVPLVSSYTTSKHETGPKLDRIKSVGDLRQRRREWLEHLWGRTVLARYERAQFMNVRLVLVNYQSVSRIITEQFGPNIDFRRMPYCAETAFRHDELQKRSGEIPEPIRRLASPEAPLIVAVSRHDPRKGLDVLLHALAALRSKRVNFRACIVGGGVLLRNHQRLADQLFLNDLVTFTGWVEEPYDYLRHADIFVLPSLEEGSGSVSLLEALQARVAIVASNIDGIPEDVDDGESALLVEPGNAAALGTAIEQLLHDVDLRRRLAQRAGEIFTKRFSAEALTEGLRQLYGELGFSATDA